MSDIKTYAGQLSIHDYGMDGEALFLSSLKEALCDALRWMHRRVVTVRYWITDRECSRDEAQEAALRHAFGIADVELDTRYSEITGYLWTDENLKVGGHDLMGELKSHVGKWLILEVET